MTDTALNSRTLSRIHQRIVGVTVVCLASTVLLTFVSCSRSGGSLFEERRAGVSRSDVRQTLREIESNVPDVIAEMEDNVPDVIANMETEMMKNADKYGISSSDVRSQLRDIESETKRQIRAMESDVRRQIQGMENDVWEKLKDY